MHRKWAGEIIEPVRKTMKETVKETVKEPPVFNPNIKKPDYATLARIDQDEQPYWLINEPLEPEEVEKLLTEERSKYSLIETSEKKKYVNTIFYNYITSHNDIILLFKDIYEKSTTTYRMNFSLGVITEHQDIGGEIVRYELLKPGELYFFTHTITDDDGNQKRTPFLPYIINKKTLNGNIIKKASEENIISWLETLLRSSSVRLIGVYSMGIKTTKMDLPIGCSFIELPSYIVNSHFMYSLNSIKNNLC